MWNFLEESVHFSTHVWTREQESDAQEHIGVLFLGAECRNFHFDVLSRVGERRSGEHRCAFSWSRVSELPF
jgi:hypothetical protein